MNKLCYLIILLVVWNNCKGQNLVLNGSLEQYSSCPNSASQIDSALFWTTPAGGTPDYFNSCSSAFLVGVPNNGFGYQNAQDGQAYAGIYSFINSSNSGREYIEGTLSLPLVAGTCYYFEMYINLSDLSKLTHSSFGVYFSDTIVSGIINWVPLPFSPQIVNTIGNATDSINWTLVSGYYTADGNESFLIIGNFKDNASTDTTFYNPFGYAESYTYIDNVSLVEIPPPCNTAINVNEKSTFEIYPNPIQYEFKITTGIHESTEMILYDITGRELLNQSFTYSTTIKTEQLAKGIYIYELRNKNGVIKKGKLVKN